MSIALLYQFARDKQTKESSEMNKGAGLLLIGLFAWAVYNGHPPPLAATAAAQPVAAESTRPAPEEFFKYENHADNEPALRGGFWNVGPAPDHGWTDAEAQRWWKENPERLAAFQERRWRAEFAMLDIFQNGCPQSLAPSLGLSRQDVQAKMNAKWNATPKAQRDEAIKFEIGLIKSRAETLHESPQWFCSLFVDRIKEGKYDQMIYHPEAKWTPGW
jgi:hypothetical protein